MKKKQTLANHASSPCLVHSKWSVAHKCAYIQKIYIWNKQNMLFVYWENPTAIEHFVLITSIHKWVLKYYSFFFFSYFASPFSLFSPSLSLFFSFVIFLGQSFGTHVYMKSWEHHHINAMYRKIWCAHTNYQQQHNRSSRFQALYTNQFCDIWRF